MSEEYAVGSNVWAKLKGYPWWPAKIEEEKNLPQIVLDKKPNRPNPIWPVFFYGSEDYGWFGRDCLRDFNTHLQEFSSNTKKGALFCKALKQATVPSKQGASINGSEEESESESKPASKSSKRSKAKTSAKQEPRKKPNTKSTGSKTKKLPTETGNGETSHDSEEAIPSNNNQSVVDPEVLLQNMVDLRHNLQRAALKDKMKDNDIVENYISEVEKFPVTPHIIQESKIGKLLRHLVRHVSENERQEKIIERSHKLIKKFKEIIHEVNPESPSHGDSNHVNGSTAKDQDDKPTKEETKDSTEQINQEEPKIESKPVENNVTKQIDSKSPRPSEEPSSPNDHNAKSTEVDESTEPNSKMPKLEHKDEPKEDSLSTNLNGSSEPLQTNQPAEDTKPSLKHQVEEDPTEADSHSLSPSKRPKTDDSSETTEKAKEPEIKDISDNNVDSATSPTMDNEEVKNHDQVENGPKELPSNSISQQTTEEAPQTITSA